MKDTVICHYGIKGMQWGVRKNKDRHGDWNINVTGIRNLKKKKRNTDDDNDYSSASNAELRSRIQRLQLEAKYEKIQQNREMVNTGKSIVRKIAAGVLIGVATTKLTKLANVGVDAVIKKFAPNLSDKHVNIKFKIK